MTTENKAGKNKKSDAAILIGVLVVFGLVLGGFGFHRYAIGEKSADWPSTTGKITGARAESRRADNKQQYMASVKYAYSVAGKQYTGVRITASDIYQKSMSGANDILRKYPIGTEAPVYYDPADPGRSVLETGLPKNVFVLLGSAAACFLLAAAITISALKKKNTVTDQG